MQASTNFCLFLLFAGLNIYFIAYFIMYIIIFLINFQNEENIEEWLELPRLDISEDKIAIIRLYVLL